MKTYLPNYFKKIGIILVILSFFVSTLSTMHTHIDKSEYKEYSDSLNRKGIENVIADPFTTQTRKYIEWTGIILSFGGILIYMFSREKVEDEFIQTLRYRSLMNSLVITWILIGILYLLKDITSPENWIVEVKFNTEAIGVLQFQLILYILIFHRKKKKSLI